MVMERLKSAQWGGLNPPPGPHNDFPPQSTGLYLSPYVVDSAQGTEIQIFKQAIHIKEEAGLPLSLGRVQEGHDLNPKGKDRGSESQSFFFRE